MLGTHKSQLSLVKSIEDAVSSLGDYLYGDNDAYVNTQIQMIESKLAFLKNSFMDENTYIKLVDRETGEVVMKYFEKGDVGALCYKAAQYYAWADCDDTYRIEEIMCDGRELYYVGWQPGMLFEFVSEDGGIVYSASFPEWNH